MLNTGKESCSGLFRSKEEMKGLFWRVWEFILIKEGSDSRICETSLEIRIICIVLINKYIYNSKEESYTWEFVIFKQKKERS